MSSPQGGAVEYSGDPLQDFTLIRFLDRFVFRNPKQLKGKRKKDSKHHSEEVDKNSDRKFRFSLRIMSIIVTNKITK